MSPLYAVGKPYIVGRTHWPEGVDYNYRGGSHELRLFLARPSSSEVRDIRQGQAEFAFLVRPEAPDVIVFLYRFGQAIPWSDQPYSWHLVKAARPDEATLPEPMEVPEGHDIIQVILVDASTGLVRGLRVLSFSPAFSAALRLAIREQAARPWPGDAAYNRQVQTLYARYPTSEAMIQYAVARTLGGK